MSPHNPGGCSGRDRTGNDTGTILPQDISRLVTPADIAGDPEKEL
jgi:hypothetical protein